MIVFCVFLQPHSQTETISFLSSEIVNLDLIKTKVNSRTYRKLNTLQNHTYITTKSLQMTENQNIEYKESWRDEYLKWVCGFANAQGGKIFIGIDDNGNTIGIDDAKRLMEDIPNKIQTTIGIIADVNLHTKNDHEYIEIVVEPSSVPISYKGEFHYRCGSTKQQLKGNALTQFLLKKTGTSWDAVALENSTTENMRELAFDIFRTQSVKRKRMSAEDVNVSKNELLDKLNLIAENGQLTRAAILLFHHNPERLIFGSYVKLGYFEGSEILYQDEIHGSLLEQAEETLDLIFTKYLKATITYDGPTRVETYPHSYDAVREAVYNALVHKLYSEFTPIQIRIYYNRIEIYNDAIIPNGWTADTYLGSHKSTPYNKLIANAFYKAGYIESWGKGIQKMCEACKNEGLPSPEYIVGSNEIEVILHARAGTRKDGLINLQANLQANLPENIKKTLQLISENQSITYIELSEKMGKSRDSIRLYVKKLREEYRLIDRVGSDKNGHWIILKKE